MKRLQNVGCACNVMARANYANLLKKQSETDLQWKYKHYDIFISAMYLNFLPYFLRKPACIHINAENT